MGCFYQTEKNMIDFRFEKVEEFNMLKLELDDIINDKNHRYRKNINKLFDLFNKTSSKITEYEKEVKKIKNKRVKNIIFDDDILKDLNNDINQLKKYNHILYDLIKESDENENENNEKKIDKSKENEIKDDSEYNYDNYFENGKDNNNEEINISNKNEIVNNDIEETKNLKLKKIFNNYSKKNLEHFLENDFENGIKNNEQNDAENDFENEFIINNNHKKDIDTPKEFLKDLSINNITHSSIIRNKTKEILNKKRSYSEQKTNFINIILVLENGQNIYIQEEKSHNFLKILKKLSKIKGEYRNIDNIKLFDENGEITDKIKNGDPISSFGFKQNKIIQVKLII